MKPDKKQRTFALWWPCCGGICKSMNSSLFDCEPRVRTGILRVKGDSLLSFIIILRQKRRSSFGPISKKQLAITARSSESNS